MTHVTDGQAAEGPSDDYIPAVLSETRFAFRLLARQPLLTITAVIALALGISSAVAMFAFYAAVLIRQDSHFTDESRLVRVRAFARNAPAALAGMSEEAFGLLRERTRTLDGAFLVQGRTMLMPGAERPERFLGASVTADAFETLGVRPVLGRGFRPGEDRPEAPNVVILGHEVWTRSFAADPDVLGRSVTFNGEQYMVIGVMPQGFRFPERHDVWTPWRQKDPESNKARLDYSFECWARLKPGVTLAAAQAEVGVLGAALRALLPQQLDWLDLAVRPVREEREGTAAGVIRLLMVCMLANLGIACANVAGLLLARSPARAREIALRAALGARRGRIVRQLMLESLLLALAGGVLGLLLAPWAVAAAGALMPPEVTPYWLRVEVDGRALLFGVGAMLLSAVAFGLAPALQLARANLADELKEGGRSSTGGPAAARLRSALVVAQMAGALVLLTVAALMTRSFLRLKDRPLGFNPNGVLTFRTGLPPTQYPDMAQAGSFFEQLAARLERLPGVEAAGFVSYLPMKDTGLAHGNIFMPADAPEPRTAGESMKGQVRTITPGALRALGVPLLRGRGFTAEDGKDAPRVAIVDQSFAESLFPGQDPIGQRIRFNLFHPKDAVLTIVGVVGDIRQNPSPAPPFRERSVWLPAAQEPDNFMSGVLRVREGDPMALASTVSEQVAATQGDIATYDEQTLKRLCDNALWEARCFAWFFVAFGAQALFLACVGVYGVTAFNVGQRTAEIGVRMALGARPRAVLAMVLRRGLRLVGVGLGLGLLGSWIAAMAVRPYVPGISAHDPVTFALVSLLLGLVALAACWLPSRRAVRVAPADALRAG